ncbi:MAG: hypothetical protein BWY15_00415 [Firmicutes bacterium ADurb.Bin193]|nr:MAG: hypothetical protein BWY15_00415 [Firmicutes bacterium ADurb.Bin193]
MLRFKDAQGTLINIATVLFKDSTGAIIPLAQVLWKNASGIVAQIWESVLKHFSEAWAKTSIGWLEDGGVRLDNDGYVYVFSHYGAGLKKYNPSTGAEIWFYDINYEAVDLAFDSSNNMYIIHNYTGDAVYKLNTNRVEQWRADSADSKEPVNANIGNDNLFVSSDSTDDIYLRKFNISTGAVIWSKSESNNGRATASTADSSGNVYCIYHSGASGSYVYYCVKYNSSGTQQWKLTSPAYASSQSKFYVDTSGNLYAVDNYNVYKISKADGSIIWQRAFSRFNPQSFAVDAEGCVYIAELVGDIYTLKKYSKTGGLVWSDTHPWDADDVLVDGDFGVYVINSYGESTAHPNVRKLTQF